MLYHFHRCLHRSIRDHSNAKTLLCWMLFPPWRPFKVRRHIIYQLDWPSSLLNKTYRNSLLTTNLTALSHDSSLPTIGVTAISLRITPRVPQQVRQARHLQSAACPFRPLSCTIESVDCQAGSRLVALIHVLDPVKNLSYGFLKFARVNNV